MLVSGGLPCIEIAFRRADTAEAIRRACEVDGLLVGAGTVLTVQDAEQAAEAGAAFALAPALNESVVYRCHELAMPFFPGIATPTEIERARSLGVKTVKAFPIAALGQTAFLRPLNDVYPDVRFIPTGGIRPGDLQAYLTLPNVVACGGSWLFSRPQGGRSSLDDLPGRIRETLRTIGDSNVIEHPT
jgi:2-dehydro-3-deoxyphosphogluconate aldolase / (4S)-4-hydroxy-2-oxoglutarate aldolase